MNNSTSTQKKTAAESSWSNRILEKHEGMIGNMMENVLLDVKCSLDVAWHGA